MAELLYDGLRAGDEDELAALLSRAFAMPLTDAAQWFELGGREHLRIVRSRAGGRQRIEGGLLQIPMGQAFGGAFVPMVGIAGVAVRSDARRTGVGTTMMRRAIAEIGERGAVSVLYASNAPVYRRAGWEAAGARFRGSLEPREITEDSRELQAIEVDAALEEDVRRFYARVAVGRNGHLDRGAYIWPRLHAVRLGLQAHGLALVGERGIEGYLYYRQKRGEIFHSLEVTDWIAATPRAHRQLWTALADLRTIVEGVTFYTAPNDPILLAHPDPRCRLEHLENWMLRIGDVPRALEARGWPAVSPTRLALRVHDDVLGRNDGQFVVHVENGRATVERGGPGSIEIDVRALASLFTGFVTPWTLRALGSLVADREDLGRLATCFGDGAPWMQEMF